MLASVARCAACGAAMILNTGKGTYRYYFCSRAMRQGKTACEGRRIRMDKLDGLVLDHLSQQLFTPERLETMLPDYLTKAEAGVAGRREKLRQVREARGDTEAGIQRLLGLVESGAMQPDDPALRERFAQLRLQKDELDRDIIRLQDSLLKGGVTISPEKLQALSVQMRRRLAEGPPELRQAYISLILSRVVVDRSEVRLEGSKAILDRIAQTGASDSLPEVLSFAD